MVKGCHPEELVPRTSTKKPDRFRVAGDKLHSIISTTSGVVGFEGFFF
jgi:hypothetical protein